MDSSRVELLQGRGATNLPCDKGTAPWDKTERDGGQAVGTHLIIDLIDAERLDDLAHVEQTLRACVAAARATLLHIHLHHFTPNGGISGVAVLAESHISIHSWPEHGYAALDVFVCGACDPHKAVDVIRAAFQPRRLVVGECLRGWRGAQRHRVFEAGARDRTVPPTDPIAACAVAG